MGVGPITYSDGWASIIRHQQTRLANISLPKGLGTPFIQSVTDKNINSAASTKQNLNGATGMLGLASDIKTNYYVHNATDFGGTADISPPDTNIDSGPSGTVNSSSASFAFSSSEGSSTFECTLDDAPFSACT